MIASNGSDRKDTNTSRIPGMHIMDFETDIKSKQAMEAPGTDLAWPFTPLPSQK